jgi:glutamate-ammonia-ligase adenylyltransferase
MPRPRSGPDDHAVMVVSTAGDDAAAEMIDAALRPHDGLEVWCRAGCLRDVAAARRTLAGIVQHGLPADLLHPLCAQLPSLLRSAGDADRVLVTLERFLGTVRSPLATGALFQRDPTSLATLLRLFAASPFLADVVIADPEAWEQVRVGQGRPEKREALAAELAAELAGGQDTESVMRGLRRFKRRQMLRIAYGDIVGGQRLETVVAQLSHVADCIVQAALSAALGTVTARRGHPINEPDGEQATIAVIALGKLGGGELNYSSDIDLVFVHSGDGRTTGAKPCSNQEFFERVVQETVRLIAEATPLGACYRVDLRLRPHGKAGPVSLALEPMLQYFDRQGRTWERQAWVKARCIAGDPRLGHRLLSELEPWVYRRWLSRADISGIKALKRRIERRSVDEGTDAADVKHGRGGIRDVEFTIQFLQLLGGGDAAEVRTGATLEAIHRLAEAGSLTDQEREILERTYRLLRTVEHRLQVLYDRQTHVVPAGEHEFCRLAARLGYGDGPEASGRLRDELAEAAELNRRILDHLLHDAFPDEAAPEPEVDLVLDPEPAPIFVEEVLGRHGFRDIPAAHRGLMALAEEKVRFLSTRRCRHFLAAIAPRLLATIGGTPEPDATLVNLVAVSDSLGGKGVLWELFSFQPPALDLTVRLCSSSPFLARLLVSNPGMLDELLDSLLVDRLPTGDELDTTLAEVCRNATDIEPMLHAFKASQQLRVGLRDVLGRQDVPSTTAALSAIPETLLRLAMTREEARLAARLGEPMAAATGERAGPILLALGKFGGREMNYASDVDVVFLYDHDGISFRRSPRGSTEGTTNAHFFAELAQRTARLFNTFGPRGRLYELDSRLRPSGRSGPPAVSLDEFGRYFAPGGPAAVWERQALVKARVVVGSPAAAAAARTLIDAASYGHVWTAEDIESIRRMRYRMEEGAKATNLKRGPGGVVDIEFIVQTLQLVYGGADPRLRTTETLGGLEALHAAGFVADERFTFLHGAYLALRRIEGRLRLLDAAARHDVPSTVREQRRLAHLLGHTEPDELVAELESLTARIRAEFETVFNETVHRLR